MTISAGPRRTSGWLRLLGIILAILGLGVAGYMGWAEVSGNDTICPGHTENASGEPGTIIVDCGFVQKSIYARAFGIPVALLGIAGYAGILGVWLLEAKGITLGGYSHLLVFGMALFGFLFTLYLTYTELFIMYTICTWCVASAVLITLIFVIATVKLVQAMPSTGPA
jgi:uncharacterized membrane protein